MGILSARRFFNFLGTPYETSQKYIRIALLLVVMRKFIYVTGVLAASNFLFSVVFKVLHLMGAPALLMASAVFGVLFIGSAAWHKYHNV